MTIETFARGYNFKIHLGNYHNIDQIMYNSGKIILIKNGETVALLEFDKVELKVS